MSTTFKCIPQVPLTSQQKKKILINPTCNKSQAKVNAALTWTWKELKVLHKAIFIKKTYGTSSWNITSYFKMKIGYKLHWYTTEPTTNCNITANEPKVRYDCKWTRRKALLEFSSRIESNCYMSEDSRKHFDSSEPQMWSVTVGVLHNSQIG